MKVSELGEFGLIERLRRRVAQQQPVPGGFSPLNGRRPELLLGIGDDCAVWAWGGDVHLSTTDTMVQDVHFSVATTNWQDLGWKALAVNVSDIAAMAGIPDYALVTLGIPNEAGVEPIDALYDGLLECATAYNLLLAGGDIVSSPVWFISIALTGRPGNQVPYPNNVLLRSAARPGDSVAVTGYLGASAAGLQLLQRQGWTGQAALAPAISAHRRPVPRIGTARLALDAGVRCGMDISDGLVGDLAKVCAASEVAAEISVAGLPVEPGVRNGFPDDWQRMALTGGEDYEILLTAPSEVLDAVRERSDLPLSIVGRIIPGSGQVTVRDEQGRALDVVQSGWDHLARR